MIRITVTQSPFPYLFTLGLALVHGQKGIVRDEVTSAPIPKAIVMHKPSWAMVMTDQEGRFDLTGKATGIGLGRSIHFHPAPIQDPAGGLWVSPLGVTQGSIAAGQNPFDFTPARDGVYFLRLKTSTYRYLRLQGRWIGGNSPSRPESTARPLARVAATAESLTVSRYGYNPISMALTSGADLPIVLKPNAGAPPPGMRKLSGGSFTAGTSLDSLNGPPHLVTVDGFFIDTTEITQEDYALLTGQRPWQLRSETYYQWFGVNYKATIGKRYPAILITWDEAALYCNLRSKRDGLDTAFKYSSILFDRPNHPILQGVTVDLRANGYRLPSEAEWEYACKGGQDSIFYWGMNRGDEESSQRYAWYRTNAPKYMYSHGPSADSTTQSPVALKLPNGFGLYDMAGNVVEHISDMGWTRYTANAETNPFQFMPDNEGRYWPRQRGGSFLSPVEGLSCSNRNSGFHWRDSSIIDLGFRVVLPVRP